ncbi:MAG: nucleotidyltransferase family protein [Sphingobacterium sp.]|nr:nucleotidyltransferase family protein [Sphingobacterium sp.]
MITSFTREELYHRHQLSHQQIDDVFSEYKSGEYPEAKAQHLGKLQTFLRISDLFNKEDIDFIPQKGPVLSYRLYSDPLYRVYNDLDFLINVELISKTVELLERNGFQSPNYLLPEDECHRQLLYKHINEFFCTIRIRMFVFELHWNLFDPGLISPGNFKLLLKENITTIKFEDRDFNVPATELGTAVP